MFYLVGESGKKPEGQLDYLLPEYATDPETSASPSDYKNPNFLLKIMKYRARGHVLAAAEQFFADMKTGGYITFSLHRVIYDTPFTRFLLSKSVSLSSRDIILVPISGVSRFSFVLECVVCSCFVVGTRMLLVCVGADSMLCTAERSRYIDQKIYRI